MKYLLLLIDASGYLFRAYHAMPKLTNSRGEATGALLGTILMLRKLIETQQPKYIGIVFDAPSKNFRHELYPEYKAHRPRMPSDLKEQIQPLQAVIQTWGLPLLSVPGFEADDVIGTLATQAAAQGISTLIATSDKDFTQLVNTQIHLIDTMTNVLLDQAGVQKKFGVTPDQIVSYLILTGDNVDHLPGVPGCGPKTARKWLEKYGDLAGLITHAELIKGKIGEALRATLPSLQLFDQLIRIRCDVPIEYIPTELIPTPPDLIALHNLYSRFESKRLLATLNNQIQEQFTLN